MSLHYEEGDIDGFINEYLKKAASDNKDFEWVAKYLISEIQAA